MLEQSRSIRQIERHLNHLRLSRASLRNRVYGTSSRQEIDEALASLEKCMEEDERLLAASLEKRYQEIRRTEDPLAREILTLREIRGMSWLQISLRIGNGITESAVKSIAYRSLRRNGKDATE